MNTSEKYMRRCLDLAVLGQGSVSPNPMVGAVIVVDDAIVGEGYTSPYGGPHAEVNAVHDVLRKYGDVQGAQLLTRATIYVSLEPCAHYGKTPPCAGLLVSKNIKEVVVGCLDPFAKVNGLGVKILEDHGIKVIVGVLEEACQEMNRRFFTRLKAFRPYVILKWAQTSDGYFAPLESSQRWITNAASKQLVHRLRSEEDAILVGKNTALIDNPGLDTRLWKGKSPKRVLIDKRLEVPLSHQLFKEDGVDVIVFNALKTDWQGNRKLVELENFDLYLPQNILYQLHLMDVQSLIVEGGCKTLQLFIDAGLWDQANIFVGPMTWGEGIKAPELSGELIEDVQVATDRLKIIRNK